jgi:pimeloyl-ACP methyl ester carboxylesterase
MSLTSATPGRARRPLVHETDRRYARWMFASSGRAQLAYECAGVLGGADVLLIHAGVNDRRSWQHVVKRLSSRHRCVAFDARGFGETVYEREDGWSPVSDAVAVLDDAGLQRPVVVACSMGGQTAIDLTLAHADRVAGLALIGTAIRGAPYPDLREGPTAELNARIEQADAAGDIDEIARLEVWMWLDGPSAAEGRVIGPARELFLDMNRRALQAEDPGEEAGLPAAWPRLDEIAVPTLMLLGRLDAEEIQAINEPAAEMIPGARLRLLDGVAHVPHLEADPATLEEITAFVDSLA